MKASRHAGVVILLIAAGVPARSDEPAELRRLFPQQAEFSVERDGLNRLVLPAEVLSACRPDLSDLRLFDLQERELALLVDGGTGPGAAELTQRVEPPVLDAARTEIRRETGPALRRETFEIGLPAVPAQTGSWVLILDSRQPEFVARVQVQGVNGDGSSQTLLEAASLFRLPRIRGAEKLRLPLPSFTGERLRVVLETEHPFWLEPALALESAREFEFGGRIAVPLDVLSVRRDGGRTVIDLARPRGLVADHVRLDTATRSFDRRVDVWDDGPGAVAEMLGSASLFRVEALAPVGESEVALRPARGDRLRVEIDDGDSPPLEQPSFSAVVRQPAVIFSADAPESRGAAGTLRFGGGRALRPRYDLAALLPPPTEIATGRRAEAAAALYDPRVVGAARIGPIRSNPDYDGEPALAFAMRPGVEIDRRVFSHVRHLRVPRAREGLSRLEIAPEDLAVLREDLGDLRVADERSRQWPYLVGVDSAVRSVPLRVEGPVRDDRASRYTLSLPVAPLRIERLVLDPDARFFDRGFRLEGRLVDGERVTLAAGRLLRPAGDPRPVTLDLDPARAESLELTVEDGDDAPLVFRSVEARVPVPELFLAAPEGEYALLLGAPDETAPRYELERVRDVVLAVDAAGAEAAALQDNPDFSLGARLHGQGTGQRVLLWVVLIGAVVLLGALTLRLARREPAA
jgi:hypothetical protein